MGGPKSSVLTSIEASSILRRIMAVVPGSPVEIRARLICVCTSRSNRALAYAWSAVKPRCPILSDSMEMYSRPFSRIHYLVMHCHFNVITPIAFKERTRVLSVHEYSTFVKSVCRNDSATDGEVVCSCDASIWY